MTEISICVGEKTALINSNEFISKVIKLNCEGFISTKSPELNIEIKLAQNAKRKSINFDEIDFTKETVESDNDSVNIKSELYLGYIDIKGNNANFELNYFGEDVWQIIKTILLKTFSFILVKEDILFFHSSAVAHNNKSYAFLGLSSAGKSTHAKLTGAKILNDDMVMFHIERKEITTYGTPFGGDYPPSNSSARLSAIFFPKKSDHLEFKKISNIDVVPKIVQAEFISMTTELKKNKLILKKILSLIIILVKQVNCYNMKSEKSDEFWKSIKKSEF